MIHALTVFLFWSNIVAVSGIAVLAVIAFWPQRHSFCEHCGNYTLTTPDGLCSVCEGVKEKKKAA